MRRALFLISPELLKSALRLPAGTEITGADWDLASNCVRVAITHDTLSDINDECQAPSVRLSVQTEWR